MIRARAGCGVGADGPPGITGGGVAATVVQGYGSIAAAPDDHLFAGPNQGMPAALGGRALGGDALPGIGRRIVTAPAVDVGIGMAALVTAMGIGVTAPHEHFPASPDGREIEAGVRGVLRGNRLPGVAGRVIARAVVVVDSLAIRSAEPAPDDHLLARPNRGMTRAGRRRAFLRQRGPPIVGKGVAGAVVVTRARAFAAEYDQVGARPNRRAGAPL